MIKKVHYYVYERKTECYKGIDGNDVQHTRTARVVKKEKVSELVNSLLKSAPLYLKHRSCEPCEPILKERFSGKYIELDFSENLTLRPKHELRSQPISLGSSILCIVQFFFNQVIPIFITI